MKDLETRKLIEVVENNKETKSKYSWEKYILWYKETIYLPSSSKFKTQVLKENHDSPTIGHVGFLKMYHDICQSFYWKGMKTDLQKYVSECDTCQRKKFNTVAPPGLLQTLHIPAQKWFEVSMDFITGIPSSEGKDCIFVVINILTKYVHFIIISSKEKASQIADSYVKNIFKLHGSQGYC